MCLSSIESQAAKRKKLTFASMIFGNSQIDKNPDICVVVRYFCYHKVKSIERLVSPDGLVYGYQNRFRIIHARLQFRVETP